MLPDELADLEVGDGPSADDQLEEIAPKTLANNSLQGRFIAPTVEIEPRNNGSD